MFMPAKNATMPAKYIVYDGTESDANVARHPEDGIPSGIMGGIDAG
jgi:hypothetical protein